MTTTVLFPSQDGRVQCRSATYAAAANGSGTLTADTTTAIETAAGQINVGGGQPFIVYQGFYDFDPSSLSGQVATAVTFSLFGTTDGSTTDFTVQARTYDFGASITGTDFRADSALSALTLLATFDTSTTWSTVAYNDFTSQAAFVTAVNAAITGVTTVRFLCCSTRQISDSSPTGDEYVNAYFSEQAGTTNDPKLTVVTTGPARPRTTSILTQAIRGSVR